MMETAVLAGRRVILETNKSKELPLSRAVRLLAKLPTLSPLKDYKSRQEAQTTHM
jgi:hypothetical protein